MLCLFLLGEYILVWGEFILEFTDLGSIFYIKSCWSCDSNELNGCYYSTFSINAFIF